MKDICTYVTSVVILVTSDVDENLSILVKVKSWIFLNTSERKFFANPADALEHVYPPPPPHASEHIAIITKTIPILQIFQDIKSG
jgi:hypothetical protein